MNRPLNRVIVVDTSKDAVKFQPENAIILDKWTGDISDKTLWDLSRFLQSKYDQAYGRREVGSCISFLAKGKAKLASQIYILSSVSTLGSCQGT